MKQTNNQYSIQSVLRVAAILRSLTTGEVRTNDIAKKLGLNRTTTFRLLKSLESAGFVMQDLVTRNFCLGPLVVNLASNSVIAHQGLILCANHDMQQLTEVTRETVTLAVQAGTQVLLLKEIVSREQIRFSGGEGLTTSLHKGAGGKIILSKVSDKELKLILENIKLDYPDFDIDEDEFVSELEIIKKQGYAKSFGEVVAGVAAIAMPIGNYVCPAVLSVMGPKDRMQQKDKSILAELKNTVERISAKLAKLI